MTDIEPDPEGKAAELLGDKAGPSPKRGPGRPKGSWGGARPAASNGRRKKPLEPEVDLGPPTEAEVQAMGVLGGVLWGLFAVRMAKLTDLDAQERMQLGTAMVPVFRKYAALFGGWEAELTLLIVAGGLVMAHLPEKNPIRVGDLPGMKWADEPSERGSP